MNPPLNDVLSEVVRTLVDVVGEEFPPDLEIGPDTTLGDDLALESIEFAALLDRLGVRFGDRVDVPGFVADLDLDEIIGLTVGDVAGYIAAKEGAHA